MSQGHLRRIHAAQEKTNKQKTALSDLLGKIIYVFPFPYELYLPCFVIPDQSVCNQRNRPGGIAGVGDLY